MSHKGLDWDHYSLIYINDLVEGLVSDVRLFADYRFLFSLVYDELVSDDVLNNDPIKPSK